LVPLASDNVTRIYRDSQGRLKYDIQVTDELGVIQEVKTGLTTDQILHVRNYSTDGITGKGPIQICREEFNKVAMLNENLKKFQDSALKVQDIIKYPAAYSDVLAKRIKQGMELKKKEDPYSPLILFENAEYMQRQPTLSAEDAQFIQTMQFKASTIATMFNIPASRLNLNNFPRPAATAEQEALEWRNEVLWSIARNFGSAYTMHLLSAEEQKRGLRVEFIFDDTDTGDINSLTHLAKTGMQFSLFTRNEARALFGFQPLPEGMGGDDIIKPTNIGDMNTQDDKKDDDTKTEPTGSLG
jgi:HK97 family phage portal protein